MPKIDEAQIYIMGDDSAVLTACSQSDSLMQELFMQTVDYLTGDFTVTVSAEHGSAIFALNNSAHAI